MRTRLLPYAVLFGAVIVFSSAAAPSGEPPAVLTARRTLERVDGSLTRAAQDALLVELKNSSGRRIRGYVFKITFLGDDGKAIRSLTRSLLRAGKDGSPRYIEPGVVDKAAVIDYPSSADGQPRRHELVLDLVLFEDGSRCGPMALPQSHELMGFARGMEATRRGMEAARRKTAH